jgi:membrane associated rhomboid family serine protease
MPSNPFDRFVESYRRSDTPFTLLLLTAMVTSFVLSLTYAGAAFLANNFSFVAPSSLSQPWRMFTYSVLTLFPNVLGLVCNVIGLWLFGSSLERSWSTRGFAAFWMILSAVTAISLSLGASTAGRPVAVGAFLPVSALLVAWAMLSPNATLLAMGAIPIKARWLALGTVLYIFVTQAGGNPLLGIFALGGCAFAYWWTRFFASTASFTNFSGSRGFNNYPAPPRKDTFFGNGGAPFKGSSSGPKRPKKILTPLDDKKTWKDFGPLAAYQRYKRRKQFERLLDDE